MSFEKLGNQSYNTADTDNLSIQDTIDRLNLTGQSLAQLKASILTHNSQGVVTDIYEKGSHLRVRDKSGKIIGKIGDNVRLTVLSDAWISTTHNGKTKYFVHVKLSDGTDGYVSADYLKPINPLTSIRPKSRPDITPEQKDDFVLPRRPISLTPEQKDDFVLPRRPISLTPEQKDDFVLPRRPISLTPEQKDDFVLPRRPISLTPEQKDDFVLPRRPISLTPEQKDDFVLPRRPISLTPGLWDVEKTEGEKTILDAYKKYGFKAVIKEGKQYIQENGMYVGFTGIQYALWNVSKFPTKDELVRKGFVLGESILEISSDGKEIRIYKKGNYKEVPLFPNSPEFLSGVRDIPKLIETALRDVWNTQKDIPSSLQDIKAQTEQIIQGKTSDEEKITAIYDWILHNISYINPIPANVPSIYSGVDMFYDKTGVCQGYADLLIYMLLFAGIEKVDYISGNVINSQDFGDIGHAWVQVGEKYYDVTWDDPVYSGGAQGTTRTPEEYLYYGLPKDLFYTNRYENENEPPNFGGIALSALRNLSQEERRVIVDKNLAALVEKYQNENYNILKESKFRKKYGLPLSGEISIEDMVNSQDFPKEDSDTSYISGTHYTDIETQGILSIINGIGFDTFSAEGWKLFHDKTTGTYSIAKDFIQK